MGKKKTSQGFGGFKIGALDRRDPGNFIGQGTVNGSVGTGASVKTKGTGASVKDSFHDKDLVGSRNEITTSDGDTFGAGGGGGGTGSPLAGKEAVANVVDATFTGQSVEEAVMGAKKTRKARNARTQ